MNEPLLRQQIKDLGLVITGQEPWSAEEDEEVSLGGVYDGIHLSIGESYYSVVRVIPSSMFIGGVSTLEDRFLFVDGRGDLAAELEEARTHE